MFEHHAQALLRPVLNVAGLDGWQDHAQVNGLKMRLLFLFFGGLMATSAALAIEEP